jgi:hypothetical protein
MRKIDRFDKYMIIKKITDAQVERDLNLTNGTINKSRKPNRDLSKKVTGKILDYYSDLNKIWFLTGEGNAIIEETSNNKQDSSIECEYCDVEELNEEACRFALPFVSTEIAQNRSVDVKGLVLSGADKLERRSVRSFLGRDVNYMQKVITNAMAPIFLPGDVLFLRFLSNVDEMLDGAIHLIDTRIYGTMVRQVSREGGVYILRSANPDFKAVRLDEDMIYSASLIVGSLRTSFNMPANSINNTEVINKQTDQIGKLIDEVILQNKRMHDKEDKTQSMIDKFMNRLDKI